MYDNRYKTISHWTAAVASVMAELLAKNFADAFEELVAFWHVLYKTTSKNIFQNILLTIMTIWDLNAPICHSLPQHAVVPSMNTLLLLQLHCHIIYIKLLKYHADSCHLIHLQLTIFPSPH